ncbi:MAG: serine hydroxymethyltransferase [Elusimicrobia bacterium CG1_02_63_36]|nr:MAG: serine hydroxymethyltransferase [Elusimicrobia bacterium CG1_02_63_36]
MHLKHLKSQDPELYEAIVAETRRQDENLELIASENYVSEAILEAQGSVLTNKYAEGYPGRRYYGGCEFVDVAERLAIARAKELFGAEHANVQPHSGAQANMAAYLSMIEPGDTVLGLDLAHGGHLTHGHPLNFSGKYFKIVPFTVTREEETIDYGEAERLVAEHKPKMLFIGASNYSRVIDWERFRKMADSVGAFFCADMAHYAGLVAAGLYPNPVPHTDATTTTTHKTLRGPRGGMILCKDARKKEINKTVFPGLQGGPLMHVIAAKAACFGEALKPEFKEYQRRTLANARKLASALTELGLRIVSGGTDSHVFSVDLRPKKVTGKDAETALDQAGITVNKNAIPYDPEKPMVASGIRIGTPTLTTRGMNEPEMELVAELIDAALTGKDDAAALARVKGKVRELTSRFPVYQDRAAESACA